MQSSLKYSYVPSRIVSEGSKYYILTQKYTPLIKSFLEGTIAEKDKVELFNGLNLISKYIYNGFFFFIKENIDSKINYEKVIIGMYYRLAAIDGHYGSLNNNIRDISEKAIFLSLGVESLNKRNFMWNNSDCLYDNFIKHTTEKVFKPLLYEYFKEQTSSIDTFSSSDIFNVETYENGLTGDEIIKNSGIGYMIPSNIKEFIIGYLEDGEEKHLDKIKPYLVKIHEEMKGLKDI